MKRVASIALLVALASACASAPKPTLESAGVAAPASFDEPVRDEEPLDDWLASFGEPGLETAVRAALAGNQDLRAAAARVEQAVAQARIAGADLYPQVSAGGRSTRQKQRFIGLPIPGAGGDEPPSSLSTSYGVSLDVSWEADLWGRIRAGKRAAEADLLAAREELEAARLSLSAQSAKAWLAATEARLQRDLAQRSVDAYRESYESIRRRYDLGVRGALDLRLIATQLHGAEALLASREDLLVRALRQLEILQGRYPSARVEVGDDLPALGDPVPAGLPAQIIERRPDLRAAERRLEAAGLRVAQAKAARYPTLRLTASGGLTSSELSDIASGDFDIWSFATNLFAPLFQAGRLKAQVEGNESVLEQSLHGYAAATLTAFQEVENALSSERLLRERQRALSDASEQARAAEKLADTQYRAGVSDILALLESQRRSLEAEGQLLSVRLQSLTNRIDLHLALGGGFGAGPAPLDLEGTQSMTELASSETSR